MRKIYLTKQVKVKNYNGVAVRKDLKRWNNTLRGLLYETKKELLEFEIIGSE